VAALLPRAKVERSADDGRFICCEAEALTVFLLAVNTWPIGVGAIRIDKGLETVLDFGVADAAVVPKVDDPDWMGRLGSEVLDFTAFAFPLRLAPSYSSDPKPTARPLCDKPLKIAFLL